MGQEAQGQGKVLSEIGTVVKALERVVYLKECADTVGGVEEWKPVRKASGDQKAP